MYHNSQNNIVEVPDSLLKFIRAVVIEKNGKQILTLEAELREDQKFIPNVGTSRLHLTNGVNHHYIDLDYSKIEDAPTVENIEETEKVAKKGKK